MFLARTRKRPKSKILSLNLVSALTNLQLSRFDKLAFRYVSWVAIPCLAGYSIYSLLYETHRGWYSFVISTLTSFVYMFGFVRTSVLATSEFCWQLVRRPNLFLNLSSTTSSRFVPPFIYEVHCWFSLSRRVSRTCRWRLWSTRHCLRL